MKQTAIEWLANEMPVIDWKVPYWKIKLEKAKEMEKEQIMDAYECGFESEHDARVPQTSGKYYFETFNTNEK